LLLLTVGGKLIQDGGRLGVLGIACAAGPILAFVQGLLCGRRAVLSCVTCSCM